MTLSEPRAGGFGRGGFRIPCASSAPPLMLVGMSEPAVEMAAVRSALGRVASELCALFESASSADVRIPRSEWSVGDVAVHVTRGTESYLEYVAGGTDPFLDVSDIAGGSLARTNATRVSEESQRDLPTLARRLRTASATLLEQTADRDGDEVVMWHGQPVALANMLGIGLAEYLLHGRDVAKALSRPWTIRPDDARLVLAAALPLLPLLVNPVTTAGVHARYDLRVRGGTHVSVAINDGALDVSGSGGSADCHVSADPVALLLVAYGRRSQWVPILTGRLVAWGRRPWLGGRFVRYLVTP